MVYFLYRTRNIKICFLQIPSWVDMHPNKMSVCAKQTFNFHYKCLSLIICYYFWLSSIWELFAHIILYVITGKRLGFKFSTYHRAWGHKTVRDNQCVTTSFAQDLIYMVSLYWVVKFSPVSVRRSRDLNQDLPQERKSFSIWLVERCLTWVIWSIQNITITDEWLPTPWNNIRLNLTNLDWQIIAFTRAL